MNYYILKMPVQRLEEAKAVFADMKKKYEMIEEEEKMLPANAEEARKYDGSNGVERYKKKIDEINMRKEELSKISASTIEEIKEKYINDIKVQTMPDGADVTGENAGDFALLVNHLITDSEQLNRILEKHDNPAFRAMARNYADARGWEGFKFIDNADALIDYGSKYFESCIVAFDNPHGYYGMLIENESEPRRLADAFGVTAEYNAGCAEAISE